LYLDRLAERGFSFATVLDSAMFHVLRDDDRTEYGITPDEIRRRFERTGEWAVEFSYRTAFERRYSTNDAYFVGVRRL
jgi:hypothetical protein